MNACRNLKLIDTIDFFFFLAGKSIWQYFQAPGTSGYGKHPVVCDSGQEERAHSQMPLTATVNHRHRTSSEIKEIPRGQKEISSVWGRVCILSVYQKVGSSFRSLNPCQERISPKNMSSSFQATLDNLFWCEGSGAKFIHREHLCGEGKEGEVQGKAELEHLCLFPQLPFCCPLVSYMGRKDCGASVIYYFDLFLSVHESGAW